MGRLRELSSDREIVLRSRTQLGRGSRNDVCLSGRGASNEHAIICWDGKNWTLRDLASRNGTRVNDILLLKREWPLERGDMIVFGDPSERWSFTDSAAPELYAVRQDGAEIRGQSGTLVVPIVGAPSARVYQVGDQWQLELNGKQCGVQDGERLTIGAHSYVLHVPCVDPAVQRTRTTRFDAPIARARVSLRSSLDGESIRITIELDGMAVVLPERSCLYALLLLARARLSDERAGIAPEDAGWTYSDELWRQLATTPMKLNTDVHRVRRMFRETRMFKDPDSIVERRRSTGQLRIGAHQLTIEASNVVSDHKEALNR